MVRGLRYAQDFDPLEQDAELTGQLDYNSTWSAFRAPEIDSEFVYNEKVDLWSLGATIYMLLTGSPPFGGGGIDSISMKRESPVRFDSGVLPSVDAQALIRGLLQTDPRRRLTLEEVRQHPWFEEPDEPPANNDYLPNFKDQIRTVQPPAFMEK